MIFYSMEFMLQFRSKYLLKIFVELMHRTVLFYSMFIFVIFIFEFLVYSFLFKFIFVFYYLFQCSWPCFGQNIFLDSCIGTNTNLFKFLQSYTVMIFFLQQFLQLQIFLRFFVAKMNGIRFILFAILILCCTKINELLIPYQDPYPLFLFDLG